MDYKTDYKKIREKVSVYNKKFSAYMLKSLKSIPKTFICYIKNSDSAIKSTKQERNYFIAVFWFAVFVLSSFVLNLSFLHKTEDGFTAQYTKANLFKNVRLFYPGKAFVLGLIFAAIFAFIYVLVRFSCVKIYTRKIKAKTVLSDSVIELGMNSIPLSLLFFLGAALCCITSFLYYLVFLFFSLLFFILLLRGIFDAVPKELKTMSFHLVVTLFSLIGFIFGAAAFALLLLFVMVSLISGTAERINEIKSNLHSFLDYLTDKFFAVINRF